MSWIGDEWKNDLPGKVTVKINQLEAELERVTRDNRQKQIHIETIEVKK